MHDRWGPLTLTHHPLRFSERCWYSLSVRGVYAARVPAMAGRMVIDALAQRRGLESESASLRAAKACAELLLETSACVGFAGRGSLRGERILRFEFDRVPVVPRRRSEPVVIGKELRLMVRDDPRENRRTWVQGSYRRNGRTVELENPFEAYHLVCALVAYCTHPAVHLHAGRLVQGAHAGSASAFAFANIQGLNRAANHWPAHAIGRSRGENRSLLTAGVESDVAWHRKRDAPRVPYSTFAAVVRIAHRCLAERSVPGPLAAAWVAAFVMHDLDHSGYSKASSVVVGAPTEHASLRTLRHVFIVPPPFGLHPPDESKSQRELRKAVAAAVAESFPRQGQQIGRCWSV